MEFGILGPLEVTANGERVLVGSRRQRTVLTILLLEANRVVATDRLVDAIWDGAPPDTARSQVQICVSALRAKFAAADESDVIATQPPGYALLATVDAVDAHRFESLVASGRAAAAHGQLGEAVEALRTALSLWRGEEVAGVESRAVQSAAIRLTERKLAVQQESIGLELQLGRHHEVLAEVAALAVAYPLVERVRALHMLALYRAGRRAEALQVFRDARDTFIVDLGMEPGAELCRLEGAILADDASLECSNGDSPVFRELAAARSAVG